MPLLGGLLGGTRLGHAYGKIEIDTSGAERAQLTMRRVGQNIGNAFSGLERKAHTFSAEVKKVNRELTVLGVTGGIISAMGIRAAASFEEVQVQLVGMTGSLEAATELTEELRSMAAKAGLPFSDLLAGAKQLLPTLQGNTKELGAWLDLTRRVAVLNQQEGIAGAAFAINEALTSGGTDLVSLTERFNISRVELREALEETGGDFAMALDQVLARMGITQATADAMGRTFNASFRAAKDAAVQLLAEGFEPLLDVLTPLLRRTAEWLSDLRETSPALATIGAGLASFVAIGAPTLLMLNQIIQALQRIKTLSIVTKLGGLGGIAAGIGKVGILAGSAYVGGAIGLQLGRAYGRATGNEQIAQTQPEDVWRTARQVIFIGATMVADTLAELAKVIANGAATWAHNLANLTEAIGLVIQRLLDLIPGPDVGPMRKLREMSENAIASADDMRAWGDQVGTLADEIDAKKAELLMGFGRFIGVLPQAAQDLAAGARAAGQQAVARAGYTTEQAEAIGDWAEQVKDIERDANQQRLDATAQYEQQRTELIASYEQSIAREAEDFARSRARQQTQLAKDIAEIQADAAEQERKWQEELNERLAELRQEGQERIAEIEEEGQRRLEQMREDHQGRIVEAAARLDARAVAEEQRRFEREYSQAEQELQERVAQERENLDERIAQEQEAHQERLQQARQADAERIADMRAALVERQALEDEDRAIRLARMEEDHQAQLEAMEAAQKARIDQINQGEIDARNAQWQGLLARLEDLGLHNDAWLEMQKAQQKASLALFELYWKAWNARMTAPSSTQRTTTTTSGGGTTSTARPPILVASRDPRTGLWGPALSRQSGGPVSHSGLAMLHGSRARPEYVLSADTTSLLRGALGSTFTQRQLVGAVAGGGGVTVQSGAISIAIHAAPGQSASDIGGEVRRVMTEVFKEIAG